MARPSGTPQKQPISRAAASSSNREKFYGYVLPNLCEKARASASAANLSIGAYLERLIAADQVDPEGRPLWATNDTIPAGQEQLPLAG